MTLLIIVLMDLSGNLPFSRPFCLVTVSSCEPLHIIAIVRDGKPGITLDINTLLTTWPGAPQAVNTMQPDHALDALIKIERILPLQATVLVVHLLGDGVP